MAKMIRYLLVVNPISGDKDKSSFFEFVDEEIDRERTSYEVYTTTGNDDEFKLKKLYQKLKPETIVAVGGDGTLQLVARIAKKTATNVGLIPFGSANGMAKELNIPKIPERTLSLIPSERYIECWRIISRGKVLQTDLLQINKKHLSVHLSDIGLNAKIVKRFEAEKSRGYLAYAKLFIKELKQKRRISYQVIADGKRHKGKGYMIVIANATKYGTGAVINPIGNISDGLFEICIVRQVKIITLLRSFLSIFNTKLRKREDLIKVLTCKNATIELKRPETLQVDGEIVGDVKKIDIKIIPGALKLLV